MRDYIYFLTTAIAGRQYYQADKVWRYLNVGTELELRAEPDNPSDPFAVSVWLPNPEAKLGYLPRTHNQVISQFLQMGWSAPFFCCISRIDPALPHDTQLAITVTLLPAPSSPSDQSAPSPSDQPASPN